MQLISWRSPLNSIVSAALVSILLIGCTSGRVGPRVGVDIPLSGMQVSGDVTSSTTNVGFVAGATIEGTFEKDWAIRLDPQVKTLSSEVLFDGEQTVFSPYMRMVGSMYTHVTYFDIPLQLEYLPMRMKDVTPFVSAGLLLSLPTQTITRMEATRTTTSGGTVVVNPEYYQLVYHDMPQYDGPQYSYLITGGLRIALSDKWELNTEARFQQLILGGDIDYLYYGRGDGPEVFYVSVSAPKYSLGCVVGILFRL